jgi:hypothetical protein
VVMALHVGSILGDAGRKNEAFMALLVKWHRIKGACPQDMIKDLDGALDLVFRVEGRLFAPDFKGIRTGAFSKKKKMLQIQIAVSDEILSSPGIAEYVTESLKQAVILGAAFFTKKEIAFNLESHLALLEKISDEFLVGAQRGHVAAIQLADANPPECAAEQTGLKYQMVIQMPGQSAEDFERMIAVEDVLRRSLDRTIHEVDGHDFGSGTMNIFIDSNDPRAAFAIVSPLLQTNMAAGMKAAFRAFDEGDFTVIWPPGCDEFDYI